MKRKELSARLLAGALSFSMIAGTCVPSLTVMAAEENQAAEAEETGISAEAEDGDATDEKEENAEPNTTEETADAVTEEASGSAGENTEVPAEETGSTEEENTSPVSEAPEETEQETPAEKTGDAAENAEGSEDTEEVSEETEELALDVQEADAKAAEASELTEAQAEETTEETAEGEGENEEEIQYVLMNIPYADFYKAEVDNDVEVDAFSSATLNKSRTNTTTMVAGSYHVNSDGSDITGITYPVKLGEGVDLSEYKQVTDADSVTISVTNRGETSTNTYDGPDALFENESYAYYVLSEEPSYYKELTVNEDGSLSFGKAEGSRTALTDVAATFMTESSYGDYQLNVDGLELGADTKVFGVVVETDKNSYGLRHMENIWRQTMLSWATGFTADVHGCPTSSAHYASMMGQTITGLVYYTSDGIYDISLDENIYVPVKFAYTLEVEDAAAGAGSAAVTLTGLPEDFDARFSVEGLENVNVSDGVLTYSGTDVKNGAYTLTITDAGNVYAPISTDFELYAEELPAAYDASAKALVSADGFAAEDLSEYLKNITAVSVNGKSYPASGRGAVTIINEDGTLKTDAEPIAAEGAYEITVTATGYLPLTFTYSSAEAEYQYVYAGLSWAEYWANEAVYNAGSSESSEKADAKGELDKGAFDTVSRATTNHGLHRGSYQCTAVITLKDGTTLEVAYYTGQTEGVLTNGEPFSYAKEDIAGYVVTGIKYVPVKVASEDYEAFKAAYAVVENGGELAGGFSENNLHSYTGVIAEVTENTNGLKTAVKNEDGSFSFSERANGSDSGIQGEALKTASDGITVTVREANGSYGEFLRVDLTGDYGDLAANMQAVEWTYYGNDSTCTNALQTYGTKFAADNWMHKAQGIQLGLTDSLRCQLPEGTDGTGYWTLTVYALGYQDYTIQIQATEDNIVDPDPEETVDTSALDAAIKAAEALKESDYTAESWANLLTELQEAREELANVHTQATVNEAAEHLNAAINALVKAEVKIDTTALQNAIKAAEALKSSDYTAESWAKLNTALNAAKNTLKAPGSQAAADASANQLNAAVKALVKAEQNQKPEEPKAPEVGTVSTYNKVQYKVTGTDSVTADEVDSKSATSVTIPDTVTIDGHVFQVTSVADKAFYKCTKLKTVSIGKNVTSIGSSAFEGCTNLTKVSGCSAVTSVGSKAFSGCGKLTTVKGMTKAETIGSKAFYNCKKLTTIGSKSKTVTLAKVKTIGSYAFQNCKAVKKVNLTSTALTKIGTSAFQGCTAMTSFTSKSTKLSSIGKKAFYGDSKLAAVSLKTTKLTKAKVGSSAFKNIKSTCTFKVPSKKVSSYKTILKARGAGSKIKVKKL